MKIFLLSQQRSGSQALAGVIGKIIEGECGEFLGRVPRNLRAKSTSVDDISQFLQRESGSHLDGTYAVKVFPAHLVKISEFRADDLLHKLILRDQGRVIRLIRRDKVLQAVSIVKAEQTRKWVSLAAGREIEPTYDRGAIANAYLRLHLSEAFWDAFTASDQFEVQRLFYEDLCDGQHFLIDNLSYSLNEELAIQRNNQSFDWADRFREDLEINGLLQEIKFKSPPRNWRNLFAFLLARLRPFIFESK